MASAASAADRKIDNTPMIELGREVDRPRVLQIGETNKRAEVVDTMGRWGKDRDFEKIEDMKRSCGCKRLSSPQRKAEEDCSCW